MEHEVHVLQGPTFGFRVEKEYDLRMLVSDIHHWTHKR